MKKSSIVFLVFMSIVAIVVYSAAYTVHESKQVVIVRFGEVIGKPITEPGLNFKLPIIEDAREFEKRWLEWDGDASQITTLDKRYIYIDVFARWRISDPLLFIQTLRDQTSAQGRLDDIIDSAARNVVANHNLIELIRTTNRELQEGDEEAQLTGSVVEKLTPSERVTDGEDGQGTQGENSAEGSPIDEEAGQDKDPSQEEERGSGTLGRGAARESDRSAPYRIEVGREKLCELILEKASAKTAQLGIELKDVQFKRINYIESVQAKVFDRMISERKRVAEAFRSLGQGISAEILGQTDKELKKIRSEAYRRAEEIMGKADAEAAAVYAEAYKKDPELYNFLKTLESYTKTIDESSWLLLSTETDYAKHIRKMK